MEQQGSSADARRLGQQTRRGISWNLAGAVATNGMRVVVLAVLGRALTSEDFGIVAAAVSVNTIVYSIRDVGIGPALVQRKVLEDSHRTTAFAVSMYLGVALAGLLFLAAPLIGETFHITGSIDVIRALGLLFVLRNIAATSRMMCRREMNFRLIAIVDTSSFTIGALASILAVVVVGGPWALVIGYCIEEVIATALYLIYSPPRFSFRVDLQRLRELLGFGMGQTVTQITSVVATYGDNLVIGHSLGASALGFYSRAFDLVRFPAMVFGTIVGNVLFSAFSKIQDDRASLALNFRRVLFVNALVLLPASAALVVLAPEAIRILIGPGWDSAVLPFQILAITMVMRVNQKLCGLVATAAGAVNGVALAFVVYVIVLLGGASLAVRWGIAGVATSTSVAAALLFLQCCYLAMRVSGASLSTVLRAHTPGLVLSALVLGAAWPATTALRAAGLSAFVVFPIVAVLAIGLCGVAVAIRIRAGGDDFVWLGQELRRIRRRRAPANQTT